MRYLPKVLTVLICALALSVSAFAEDPELKWMNPFSGQPDYTRNLGALGGDLIPAADATYDIGSAALSWEDGYFHGDIYVASDTISISNTGSYGLITGLNGEIEWASTDLTDIGTLEADKIDTPEIYNSLGDLKIMPDRQGDVILFGDTDVANAADGKSLYVYRKAEEGDNYFQLYTDNFRIGRLAFNGIANPRFEIRNDSGGEIQIGVSNAVSLALMVGASGDIKMFEASGVGENRYLKQSGYITTATNEVDMLWQVNDTTDMFELTRENVNVLGFDVQMPLITDGVTVSGTSSLEKVIVQTDKFIICNVFTSAGINACIDTLGAEGGEVYLPEGEYVITDPIDIDYDNTTIRGSGAGTILKVPDNHSVNLRIINMNNSNYTTLSNFKIDGNKDNTSYTGSIGVWIGSNNAHHKIINIWIEEMTGDGIFQPSLVVGEGAEDILIQGCTIRGITDDGMDINAMRNSQIIGNTVENIGDNGIDSEGAEYISFTGNIFNNCGASAIELEQEQLGLTQYCTVSGNVITNCGAQGVSIASGGYNTVSGNTIEGCETGVLLSQTANGDVSIHNLISGNNIINSTDDGIRETLDKADYNIIIANKIVNSTNYDYLVRGPNTLAMTQISGEFEYKGGNKAGSFGLSNSDTDVRTDDVLGLINIRSNEASTTTVPTDDIVATMSIVASAQHTGGHWPVDIIFSNVNDSNVLTERLKIGSDGDITALGTYNDLTLTALATGFSIAGGTTSKTLTVEDTSLVNQDLTTDAGVQFGAVTATGDIYLAAIGNSGPAYSAAGYFYEGTNEVKISDGTNAITATGNIDVTGESSFDTSGSGNTTASFVDGTYNVYLGDSYGTGALGSTAIAISGGGTSIYCNGAITTLGTIQAEHLYSTDDSVIADDLYVGSNLLVGATSGISPTQTARLVMDASTVYGLNIDGTTTDFNVDATDTYCIKATRDVTLVNGEDVRNYIGIYAGLYNKSTNSKLTSSRTMTAAKFVLQNTASLYTDTINSVLYYIYPFNFDIDDSATYDTANASSGSNQAWVYGFNIDMDVDGTFTDSGSSGINKSYVIRGVSVDIEARPTVTGGNAFYPSYMGVYVNDVDGNDVGGSKCAGLWIDNVRNADHNYGIVLDTDGNGDSGGCIVFGEGQDARIWYDAADMWINSDAIGSGSLMIGSATSNAEIAPTGNIYITSPADPQLRLTHTAGVDLTEFYTNSDGELEVMPTARTLYLGDGTAGDATFGFYGSTSVYTFIHDDSEGNLKVSANSATNYTQFEDDGDLVFVGTAGLCFGSCSMYDGNWSQVAAQNTWYNVSDTDFIDGQLNNATHDGSGEITVTKAGIYKVDVSLDIEVSAANKHVEIGFEVSNSGSAQTEGIVCIETKFADEEHSMSTMALLDLTANATIEFCVRTIDVGTPTIIVDCVSLNCVQIGGT